MKVLHVLASNKYSGAENVACQIIDMFKNDRDIEMAYCSPEGSISETLKDKNILYIPIKKLSLSEIKKVIKEYNPDVIHCHDLKAVVVCSNFKNIKKIAHIHVNHPKMSKLSLRSIIAKYALKKSNHIFWVSDSCFNDFIFKKSFKSKSDVLNNIISIEDLEKKIDKDREKYEYDVVYCGRLTEQKNPMRMIDIFEKLKLKKQNVKIVVCGNGDLFDDFKNEIKNRGLEDNVQMLGFVANPFDIIFHSKIMILTSYFEGTPMTALESLALGTPIVSTNIDGMKKLITNGYNGYLYETNEEAVEIIIDLINNEQKLLKLKKEAKDFSEKYNDKKTYKSILCEKYEELL